MTDTINVPESFIENTTISWVDTFDDYPAPGHVLTYTFVNQTTTVSVTATQDGSTENHKVQPDTSQFSPGDWRWQIMATETSSGNKTILGYGMVRVVLNFADTVSGHDNRLIQEKILEQVNEYLLNNTASGQQKITYKDMEVWNTDPEQLMKLRDKLMREIAMIKQRKTGKFLRSLRFRL